MTYCLPLLFFPFILRRPQRRRLHRRLCIHTPFRLLADVLRSQCCTGGSRRTTTAPTDSASRYTLANRFRSAGSIPPSSSWVSIVYGKAIHIHTAFIWSISLFKHGCLICISCGIILYIRILRYMYIHNTHIHAIARILYYPSDLPIQRPSCNHVCLSILIFFPSSLCCLPLRPEFHLSLAIFTISSFASFYIFSP